MEYYKDLLENDFTEKKRFGWVSIFNLVVGIFMLVFAVIYFSQAKDEGFIKYLAGTIFLLNGIIFTLRGFNFQVEKLFGKAFIKINNSEIIFKPNPLKSAQTMVWKEIESVNYTAGKFTFLKKDGTKTSLSVMTLSYNTIQEIKKMVSEFATLKDITTE